MISTGFENNSKKMRFLNLRIILQICFVFVLVFFLFWAVFSGLKVGKELAQSEVLVKNFETVKQGITYFYSDQNRIPSVLEFSENKIMLNYFSAFPLPELISARCPSSWMYKNIEQGKTVLSVCLPKKIGKLNLGWNKFNLN